MLHSSPNSGVVGASPHTVQIQVDMGCQVTLALRDGKGICPIPRKCSVNSLPLHFPAAGKAAAIRFYSCSNEFLPYIRLSDLPQNSFSFRVKNPPLSRLTFHLVRRERPPRCNCLATIRHNKMQ